MSHFVLVTALLIVSWRLRKAAQVNRQQQQQLTIFVQDHAALGQSIAALSIQLQVASKLWQTHPVQAQHALKAAYTLSLDLMQDIRHIAKSRKPPYSIKCDYDRQQC